MTDRDRAPLLFALWAVVGAGFCLGALALLTIGVFVLAVTLAAAAALLRWGGTGRGAAGLVTGAAAPLFYVAWANRGGPGEVCHAIADGLQCTDAWSPWPWLVGGAVLAVAGALLFVRLGRVAGR